jgi:pimeloyl-ACP methyl ester carboxylesterase
VGRAEGVKFSAVFKNSASYVYAINNLNLPILTNHRLNVKTMTVQNLPSIADKTILIDGSAIAYKDCGSGIVILCLHAVGHSSSDFQSLFDSLSGNYRVIAIDFPGHGRSDSPTAPVSASYFAMVVDSFIQQLNLHSLVIVGNSIGGATALRLAAGNQNIKALALADPGGLDKRGFIGQVFIACMVMFFQMGQSQKKSFQNNFRRYYQIVLPSKSADARRNEIVNSAYHLAPLLVQAWQSFGTAKEDLRPLIKSVQCPVLFTWGTKDKIVQLSRNKRAINMFSNKQLIQYEIGHTPYIECPDDFIKDFVDFLKRKQL